MPSNKYKVFAVGAPVGEGVTQAIHVGIAAVAKKASAQYPHLIYNEIICANVARALLLPCPPGAVLEHGAANYYFSLDFNHAGQALPPINNEALATSLPELCWGIILFDILIMNGDRHRKNISFDTATNKVQIFDHSHALLRSAPDIPAHLQTNEDALAIGNHCLAKKIVSRLGMDTWTAKILSKPNYFFEDLVRCATEIGYPVDHTTALSDFLKRRRDKISTLVGNNAAAFPVLQAP